jgi:hypothetical protein
MGISPFIPHICGCLGGPQDQRGHLAAPHGLSRAQLALFPTRGHWRKAKKRHVRASSGLFWFIERAAPTEKKCRGQTRGPRAPTMGPNALSGRRRRVGCRGPNCDRNRKWCCFGRGGFEPEAPGGNDFGWVGVRGTCFRKTATYETQTGTTGFNARAQSPAAVIFFVGERERCRGLGTRCPSFYSPGRGRGTEASAPLQRTGLCSPGAARVPRSPTRGLSMAYQYRIVVACNINNAAEVRGAGVTPALH